MARRTARRRRFVAAALATGAVPAAVYIALVGLAGDEPGGQAGSPPAATEAPVAPAAPSPTVTPAPTPPARSEALAVLDTLPVKGRAPKTGYDRDQFGPAWSDVDGNGCDTRNDILTRDLTDRSQAGDGCTVLSGLLAEPYSGTWIRFARGEHTSTLVQVDHVVSLSDAWQKGAQQLTPTERERFANDPLNLLAVDGDLNQRKSDGDAATWLPPNKAFRCQMVAHQVAVKSRYELWVTQAEKEAIVRVLSACPEQRLPSATDAPIVGPMGEPPARADAWPSRPDASDVGSDGAFANCTAAREAGAAPVYRDDPGYGAHLDRDGDGVGCE